MESMTDRRLPIVPEDDAPAACGTVHAGLSDDEVVHTTRLRELAMRARALQRALASADSRERERLTTELDELRRARTAAAAERERAYRDKMRSLGHLEG